jgi:hypothetical protein
MLIYDIMKKKLINNVLFLSLLLIPSLALHSQETRINPGFVLKYFRDTDDKRIIQALVTCTVGSETYPLTGAEISLLNGSDRRALIGKAITDDKGVARFEMNPDLKLKAGNDGMLSFITEFSGNDTIEKASSEISVRDLKMVLTLSEVDSIKSVSVKAFSSEGGIEKPVTGETVKVYVPRMFSMLPIGDLTLDDSGTASIEFPSDLPGDKEGNLVIIAKIEDNSTYGTIEKSETIKWGMPTDYSVPVTHRALWTSIAPKWMIYSLSVLLAGVWGHYLYAIISLIRIKIDAKRQAAKEYRA